MHELSERLREAVDRYRRVQEVARLQLERPLPSEPGFHAPTEVDLAIMNEVVAAIDDVRQARAAWNAAGRPSLI